MLASCKLILKYIVSFSALLILNNRADNVFDQYKYEQKLSDILIDKSRLNTADGELLLQIKYSIIYNLDFLQIGNVIKQESQFSLDDEELINLLTGRKMHMVSPLFGIATNLTDLPQIDDLRLWRLESCDFPFGHFYVGIIRSYGKNHLLFAEYLAFGSHS